MTATPEAIKDEARKLLSGWKGDAFAFGVGCLDRVGPLAREVGGRAVIAANSSAWMAPAVEAVQRSLRSAGVKIVGRTEGARPNSPLEDVYRIEDGIRQADPDVVVAVGGGSTIDAAKASAVLAALAGGRHEVAPYFGVGKVTAALEAGAAKLPAFLAVQTAAGSASHLTKYSNLTDLAAAQKMLIIDEAIIPARAVFDYGLTRTAPAALTLDGAFDGLGHVTEAYWGAGAATIDRLEGIAAAAVELIVASVGDAVARPDDLSAREGLGLGTDLGGYAIMIGSTSGPHLNSFSLVDVLSHGRACAVLEPYYAVFFAPAIERQLRVLGGVYARHGLIRADLPGLAGRELGVAVAEGMMALSRKLGFPTTLGEVGSFSEAHVARALAAAKDPKLASKLQGMPTPLAPEQVDEFMGSVLAAATSGELARIKELPRSRP